ncbi:hypothetical protein CHUAL_001276 [Chamberlinius hualienensis]
MLTIKQIQLGHEFQWTQRKNNAESNHRYSLIFLLLLQITGLKIKLNSEVKLGILRRFYVLLILLICCGNLVSAGIVAFIKRRSYYSFVTKIDPFVEITIVYAVLRKRQINVLFTDIWKLAHKINPTIKINFWIHVGYSMIFIYSISAASLITEMIYFENLSKNIYSIATIYYATTILFTQLCSILFGTFITLNLFLLNESFSELTAKFQASKKSVKTKLEFTRKYLQVTNMVRRFNDVFSPVVTIFSVTRILQVIVEVTLLSTLSPNQVLLHPIKYVERLTFVTLVIITFFTLVELGQKLKNQAQEGITSLLKNNLQHSQDLESIHIFHSESQNCKECKIISMFSGRMIVSPVTITASDLFNVDYSLVLAVISVSVTYISLIQPRSEITKCVNKPAMMSNSSTTASTDTTTQSTATIEAITTIYTDTSTTIS